MANESYYGMGVDKPSYVHANSYPPPPPNILGNCSFGKTFYKTRQVLLQFTTA